MAKPFWAEIMKPGTWTSMNGKTVTFSAEDLLGMVKTFRKLKGNVDPVLRLGGHPDANGLNPAVGWVEDMKVSGDRLMALFSDMPDVVVDAIGKRRYRKVSPGLWGNWEYEGETYPWVLNHVALLGAHLPAISGLKDLQAYFTSEQVESLGNVGDVPEVVISFTMSDEEDDTVNYEALYNEEKAKREKADVQVVELTAQVKDLGVLTKERDTLKTENKALTGQVAEFTSKAARSEVEALVNDAVKAGRVRPADKDSEIGIGLSLRESSMNFSSEDKDAKSPFGNWSVRMTEGPKVVDFQKKAETGDEDEPDNRDDFDKDFDAGAAAVKALNESN